MATGPDLWTYAKSFGSRWGVVFGVAVTVAGALPTALAPPWPDENGATARAIAVLACFIGVTFGYYFSIKSRKRELWLGMGTILVSVMVLLAYGYLLSVRVHPFEQVVNGKHQTHRVVVGSEVRYPADASKTKEQLIQLYGLDGGAWTDNSLAFSRLGLIGSYCLFFAAFTFGFGVLQRRGTSLPPKPTKTAKPAKVT